MYPLHRSEPPRTARRRSLIHVIVLTLALSFAGFAGLSFATPASAIPLPGGAPGMPKPLELPAQPIVSSSGAVGYLPASWNVTPSGAFGYSIPVDVPEGRAGVQPDLQLHYDSGSGNGLLGVGWSVAGAGSWITRCDASLSTDGKVAGVNYEPADRFCLDGAELVQLGAVPGGPPPTFAEYRTEDDSFAQILATATLATAAMGPDQFEVKTKDGRIRTYLPQAAIRTTSGVAWNPDPVTGDEQTSFPRVAWLLYTERDRSGNEMTYEYDMSNNAGGAQFLVHRIAYTSHASAQTPLDAPRYVEFGYENRSDTSFRYQAGVRYSSTKRLKTISMYAPNPAETTLVWQYKFAYATSLSGRSLLSSVAKCGPSGGCLRSKNFTWEASSRGVPTFTQSDLGALPGFTTGQSRAPFAQAVDLNGDGSDDLLWTPGGTSDANSPVRARLAAVNPNTGVVSPLADDQIISGVSADWPADSDLPATRLMDTFGNGIASAAAMYTDASGPHAKLLRWDASKKFVSTGIAVSGSKNTIFADLNGDGRADYITDDVVNNGLKLYSVRINNGAGFDAPLTSLYSSGPISGIKACPAPRVTDVDGDGRADLVGQLYTALGCTYDPWVLHLDAGGLPVAHPESDKIGNVVYAKALPQISHYRVVNGDFNGDNLDDYLLVPNQLDPVTKTWDRKAALLWNTGAGLVVDSHVPSIAHDSFADIRAVDVNGDGRSDLVTFINSATNVLLSGGDGTFAGLSIAADGGTADPAAGRATSVVGDFTGDGRPDAVRVTGGHLLLLSQDPGYADLMTGVTDQGTSWAREAVTYSTAWTDHPEKLGDNTCSYPVRCIRRGLVVVRQVLSREHFLDPTAATQPYVLHYAYEDPAFEQRGRGFLGFGLMRVWDPQRPAEITYNFQLHRTRVDSAYYPYVERPLTVTTAVPLLSGVDAVRRPTTVQARITRTASVYELRHLNSGHSFVVFPKTEVVKEWEQQVTATWGALSSATPTEHISGVAEPASPLRRTDRSSTFDDYGNMTEQTSITTGGAGQTMHVDVDNRLADWLISLPTHETVTATVAGNLLPPVTRSVDREFDALGRLTATWAEKGNADPGVTQVTSFVLNDFGTMDSMTVSAAGLPDRVTRLVYTPAFPGQPNEWIFPYQTWSEHDTAAYRPSQWAAIHPAYGLPVASEDVNGVQTSYQYDDLGRPTRLQPEGQDLTTVLYTNRVDAAGGTNGTVASATIGVPPQMPRIVSTVTDAQGRTVGSSSSGFNGQTNTVSTRFDQMGRVSTRTVPAPGGTTSFTYDSLDRVVGTIMPDGAVAKNLYSFFTSHSWSPSGNETTTTFDIDGQITTAVAGTGTDKTTTNYQYGPFGLLWTVTDDKGNKTVHTYDVRGRQVQLDDPDTGHTTDSYYGTGDLHSQNHQATGHTTTFGYDDLGRNVTRDDEDGTSTFTFDTAAHGIGKMAYAISTDKIRTDYEYDSFGRQTATVYTDLGTNAVYRVDQTYTATGRLTTTAFPEVAGRERFTLSYGYNGFGIANSVSDVTAGQPAKTLWTVQSRMPNQALQTATFGASTATLSYDSPSGRLHNITVASPNGKAENVTYGYQADGFVQTRTESITDRLESFGYDSLGRLTSWNLTNGNDPAVPTTYDYDTIGNLTQITRKGLVTEKHTYGLPNGGQPHTLTGVTVPGSGTQVSLYDGQGRQTQGDGRTATYTAASLPRTVTVNGQITTFAYDAFGRRVKETTPTSTTFTVPERYEHRVSAKGTVDVFFVDGIDGPVGQVVYTGTATKVEYAVHDGLGTVVAAVDDAGVVTDRFFFEPFGGRVKADGTPETGFVPGDVVRGFTGNDHDDALGLIDMRGRVYDPVQHTFLSADPRNLPGENPYTYVRNSPLNYTDPTGFQTCDAACQWANDYSQSSFNEFVQAGDAYYEGGVQGLANHEKGLLEHEMEDYEDHVKADKREALENAVAEMMKSDNSGYDAGDGAYIGAESQAVPTDAPASPSGSSESSTEDSIALEGTWDTAAGIAAAIALAAGVPLPALLDAAVAGQDIADIVQGCQSNPASCQQSVQEAAQPATGATTASNDAEIVKLAEEALRLAQKSVLDDQENVEFWSKQLQNTVNRGPWTDHDGFLDTAGYFRTVALEERGMRHAADSLNRSQWMYDYSANQLSKLKNKHTE
jgi:RHS repeat-associated protein